MKVMAVIVAAGSGLRAGGEKPKQYQLLGDKPVLRHTLEAFITHPLIAKVITVIGEGHDALFHEASAGLDLAAPVTGGASRQESCRLGIEACASDSPDAVLIHDAARPFISHNVITAVIEKLRDAAAVIPALAVADTIKQARDGIIGKTLDRSALFYVQTPQGFHFEKIRAAYRNAVEKKLSSLTDDASVAEASGIAVHIVPGDEKNHKLTTMEDIRKANRDLGERTQLNDIRVGSGMDFHVFEKGKSVWLCGVEIPHTHKLKGHSDADVALHALTDAILGTIGEGDIGTHFPPSDPQWKNARSKIFVAKARQLLEAKGGVIANVDITILAEAPKVSPHLVAMKAALSEMLGITLDRIAIKATTTEKMGAIGRKEGMAAMATATVRLP